MKTRYFKQSFTLPIGPTVLSWLLADRMHLTGAWLGVYWSSVALMWLITVVMIVLLAKADAESLDANEVEKRLAALEARR